MFGMGTKENEMVVITKAKELYTYVMLITQKSPKHSVLPS